MNLILFFPIACAIFLSSHGSDTQLPPNTTIVLKHHGVLLKPGGLVALNTNENFLSAFRKIEIPQLEQLRGCECNWISRFNIDLIKTAQSYVELFNQIANPPTSSHREKRFLGAIGIGLGLTDMLLGGISYVVLQKHVKAVESKLENFIETEHAFDEKILKIDEKIVHVIKKTSKRPELRAEGHSMPVPHH